MGSSPLYVFTIVLKVHCLTTGAVDIVAAGLSAPILVVVFALGRAHKQGESFAALPTLILGIIIEFLASGDDDNWTTAHFRLGLVLLLLGIIQNLYGWGLHVLGNRVPVMGAKSLLRYIHPITGVSFISLSSHPLQLV